jgi:ABC-2 type transport system permease protein
MSTTALAVRQLRYEQKVFWRNPAAMFFTIAFPVVLLVIFGSLNGGEPVALLGGLRFTQYYVPSMAAFGAMSACFANLAGRFVYRRESGALKRIRATPIPLKVLIGGFIANAVLVGVLVTFINTTIGVAFYGVTLPHRWLAFALVILIGSSSFCALGVAFSTLVPNLEATDPMIFGIFMPLVFISGAFFPIEPSSPLARLANLFPVRHLIEASFASFDTRSPGAGVAWTHLAIVAAWGLAAAVFAVRRFRWEPTRT